MKPTPPRHPLISEEAKKNIFAAQLCGLIEIKNNSQAIKYCNFYHFIF